VRYEITHNKFLGKGLFSITDDSGSLRFRVERDLSLRDPGGEEVAAVKRHSFLREADIFASGQLQASVHVARLGMSESYNVKGPAGELTAAGNFFGRQYTLTVPSGTTVATVSQRPGLRENFDAETAPGQDDVLLLAVIIAIEELRQRKS
jgi:uncharacterized protein YxjI